MLKTQSETSSPSAALAPADQGSPHYPIRTWAFVGAIWIALEAWVLGAWIVSGQATRTPVGPNPVPTWMAIAAHAFEVGASLSWVILIFFFVIRPRRRLGYIPTDGRLLLGMTLIFWLDCFLNYFQNNGTYNAVFFNLGSWVAQFPGSTAPRAELLAEPLFFVIPAYAVFVFTFAKLGAYVMKRAHQRWPRIGRLQLIGICLAAMIVSDFIIEMAWIRLGYYTFAGTIHSLTLFAGEPYQFPIYESIFAGFMWCGYASIRYFTDANGDMYVERGVANLNVSDRRRAQLRFVALYGALCTVFFTTYCLPMSFIGANADPWPKGIVESSYLNDGMCGVGTPYHCPGPRVPIPRDGSAFIAPSGSLTGPAIPPETAP